MVSPVSRAVTLAQGVKIALFVNYLSNAILPGDHGKVHTYNQWWASYF
jgi:hypothetical protein